MKAMMIFNFGFSIFYSFHRKLSDVHRHAWTTWENRLANVSGLQLEAGSIQNAGDIPQSVLDAIREGITNLPPPTKYTKTLEFAGKRKRKADGQHELIQAERKRKRTRKRCRKRRRRTACRCPQMRGSFLRRKERGRKKRTRRNTQTKPRAKKPEGHAEISVAEKNGSCL